MTPPHRFYAFAFLFSIPPTIISWIALVAPRHHGIKHTGALAVIPPPGRDGPSIWFGLIRTCSRANASSPTECDQYSTHNLFTDFKYDVSILPPDAPLFALRVASVHLRRLAVTAAVFSTVFTIIALFMTLIFWRDYKIWTQARDKFNAEIVNLDNRVIELGLDADEQLQVRNLRRFNVEMQGPDDDPRVARFNALNDLITLVEQFRREEEVKNDIGDRIYWKWKSLDKITILAAVISFSFGFVGSITFAILWVHFEKACRNFNLIYKRNGTPPIPLDASLGLTFNLAYAGYILALIPFGIVCYDLHDHRDNWRWANEVGRRAGIGCLHLFM